MNIFFRDRDDHKKKHCNNHWGHYHWVDSYDHSGTRCWLKFKFWHLKVSKLLHYQQSFGVIGGLSLDNLPRHKFLSCPPKPCQMFVCKTCLCALCFTQCWENGLSEFSPSMTPRLIGYCDNRLLGHFYLLVPSGVEFWGRNCVRRARWRGVNRTKIAIKERGFHTVPGPEIYTSEYFLLCRFIWEAL